MACSGFSTITVSRALHAQSLLENLNKNRKNTNMCDGIVCIGNVDIPVQCNVLSAASPYFRGLFNFEPDNTMQKTYERMKTELPAEIISPPTFLLILDFIYTGCIILNEDNIQDILQASDLLLMSDLKEMCCDYLEKCICTLNCLGISRFADRFSCPWVRHAATCYLDDHFVEVSQSEEFLQLTVEELQQILKREMLCIPHEETLLDCLLRWVSYEKSIRITHFADLLKTCICLPSLDFASLKNLAKHELIQDANLAQYVFSAGDEKQSSVKNGRGYMNVLVVTGGEGPIEGSANSIGAMEIKSLVRCTPIDSCIQHTQVATWINLPPMSTPRIGHGLVEAGGCLYAIGGKDSSGQILLSGEMYNPKTDTWTPIPNMNQGRVSFGLVAIDDKIYAVGGSNDMSDPLTSMEEYHIYEKHWRKLPDMTFKRAWSAYAVCDKKIYVIAGGIMGKLYESVECYDPRTERWFSVSPMKERRYDARALGYHGNIFVFGGLRRLECPSAFHSGGSGMKFCGSEVYEGERKQWFMMNRDQNMCSMTDMSHIDSVVQCGEEILVIGDLCMGNHGNVYHHIRAYHPPTGSWRGIVQNHPPNQKGITASMLRVPKKLLHDRISCQNHENSGGDYC